MRLFVAGELPRAFRQYSVQWSKWSIRSSLYLCSGTGTGTKNAKWVIEENDIVNLRTRRNMGSLGALWGDSVSTSSFLFVSRRSP